MYIKYIMLLLLVLTIGCRSSYHDVSIIEIKQMNISGSDSNYERIIIEPEQLEQLNWHWRHLEKIDELSSADWTHKLMIQTNNDQTTDIWLYDKNEGNLAGLSYKLKPMYRVKYPNAFNRLLFGSENTEETKDIDVLHKKGYPTLYLVPVTPKDTTFHAESIMKSNDVKDLAYHIIAIGILGKKTPEVIKALDYAQKKYGGVPVPLHYDWPDSIDRFKHCKEQNPDHFVADWPGSRGIHFIFLIEECRERLHK